MTKKYIIPLIVSTCFCASVALIVSACSGNKNEQAKEQIPQEEFTALKNSLTEYNNSVASLYLGTRGKGAFWKIFGADAGGALLGLLTGQPWAALGGAVFSSTVAAFAGENPLIDDLLGRGSGAPGPNEYATTFQDNWECYEQAFSCYDDEYLLGINITI